MHNLSSTQNLEFKIFSESILVSTVRFSFMKDWWEMEVRVAAVVLLITLWFIRIIAGLRNQLVSM